MEADAQYGVPALLFPDNVDGGKEASHQTMAEDNILYLDELYGVSLRADITILSACETGLGQYLPGEGVMSFARAFVRAGSRNVLTSLWQLHDGTAQQLLSQWHRQVSEGVSYDEALRNSKLQWLETAGPLEAHPGRWAGLILVGQQTNGDVSTLQSGMCLAVILPMVIGILLLVIGLSNHHFKF